MKECEIKSKNDTKSHLQVFVLIGLTGAATDSKAVGSWGTLVTVTTHDVGFTSTLTPHSVTLATERALRVTLTG